MLYYPHISRAVKFATKTHDVYQKQKRKGKDIAYITHPLTVGLILAKSGASDDIIMAGILHDTIEDSIPEKKVSYEMLAERFGREVADIVLDVTEQDKSLPWMERKLEALKHIKTMSEPSLWVKTADVIGNISELLEDYQRDGDNIFSRFNASKKEILDNRIAVINELIKRWDKAKLNPMLGDLKAILQEIGRIE